jgi:hypothetical protein
MDTRIMPMASMQDDIVTNEFDELAIRDDAALEAVRHANCTLIQTTNSFYLFLLTDPAERRGLLVGGALGECPTSAVLLGAIRFATDFDEYPATLNTGLRAVFLVELAGLWKHVITSPVVSLAHAPVHTRMLRAVTH